MDSILHYNQCHIIPIVRKDNMVFPRRHTAKVGDAVQFSCLSVEPATWTFDGRSLPTNVVTVPLLRHTGVSLLTIPFVTLDNSGQYTCNGNTQLYYFDAMAILKVNGKT